MENNNNEKNSQPIEFNFEAETDEIGLIFKTERTPGLVFESDVPKKVEEDAVPSSMQEPDLSCESESTDESNEFSVPDVFCVNEKYNTPIKSDDRPRIYATYVPRFTGASDNYRMKGDPRPPIAPESKQAQTVVESELPKEDIKEPVLEVTELSEEPQTEKKPEETVVVNVTAPHTRDELDGESFSIFKFASDDRTPEDRMTVNEENANRRALEELKARQAERKAREAATRLAEERERREAAIREANRVLSPDDYTIPDPEMTVFSELEHTKDSDFDAPGEHLFSEKTSRIPGKVELVSAGQRDSFKDKFLDSLLALRIRLVAIALLALGLLFFENASLVGIDVEELFGIAFIPSAYAIIDFQIAACAILLALPEIIRSVKALFCKIVLPELSLILTFGALFAYTLVLIFASAVSYPVFGFLASICAFCAVYASYLCRKCDFASFKLVFNQGEKRVLDVSDVREFDRINLSLDGAVDGFRSSIAKTFRTNFVSNFFSHTSKRVEKSKVNLITAIISLFSALLFGFITYFVSDRHPFVNAAAAFTLITVFSTSVIIYLVSKLPYYHAGVKAVSEDCAVIGEGTYIQAAGVNVVAFEDTEIFGVDDVNLKRFAFYGDEEHMTKCTRYVASLFASVGGPLNFIFSKTVEKHCTPATNPKIENDGISGKVDGRTVCVGTAEYMHRYGIQIPEDNDRAYGLGAESTKTMYGAEGGEVFAKFYVRYSFSEEFTRLLPSLREEGIVPLVYTSDPNISNDLLRTLTMGADCVRVMRRRGVVTSKDKIYPKLSSGAVTLSGDTGAVKIILISKKYKRFVDSAAKIQLTISSAGAALSAILCLLSPITVPTVVFGAVQLASFAVFGLVSKNKFRVAKNNKGK